MGMLQREEALAIARRVVSASGADETEVTLESEQECFVRFADNGPTQSADRERQKLAIRARLSSADGWREGKATCDGTGEEQTRAALKRALELAEVAPPNAELSKLEGVYDGMDQSGACEVDAATLKHGFDEKAEWVRTALALCNSAWMQPAGMAATAGTASCLVNSAGREVYGACSRASLSLTASAPGFAGGSGFAEGIARRVSDLDSEAIFRRALDKAVASQESRSIPAGEYTVLLEPNAVSSILLFAAYQGFGAQDVHESASFLCGRVGERLFAGDLLLADDANNAFHPGLAFDGEGAPRQRVELLRDGALTGPVTDSQWARKLDTRNTGHALPMPNTCGPKPSNLVLGAGDKSSQELLAGIERGLLISQFHYTNLIDPQDLLLTGMTRNGTFLVENGEIVGAVKNLRFTESLVNALSNVSGIGKELEVAGALFSGEIVTPALRIDGFRFTSTTDF